MGAGLCVDGPCWGCDVFLLLLQVGCQLLDDGVCWQFCDVDQDAGRSEELAGRVEPYIKSFLSLQLALSHHHECMSADLDKVRLRCFNKALR